MISIYKTTTPSEKEKQSIFEMWNSEYPEKLVFGTLADMDLYFGGLKNTAYYFAANERDEIMAWADTFERDGENWFTVIVGASQQNKGLGKKMLDALKVDNAILNGWVIDHIYDSKADGSDYDSPLAFYRRNGFHVENGKRLETDTISAVKVVWKK